jgi:hypothetical protein
VRVTPDEGEEEENVNKMLRRIEGPKKGRNTKHQAARNAKIYLSYKIS